MKVCNFSYPTKWHKKKCTIAQSWMHKLSMRLYSRDQQRSSLLVTLMLMEERWWFGKPCTIMYRYLNDDFGDGHTIVMRQLAVVSCDSSSPDVICDCCGPQQGKEGLVDLLKRNRKIEKRIRTEKGVVIGLHVMRLLPKHFGQLLLHFMRRRWITRTDWISLILIL